MTKNSVYETQPSSWLRMKVIAVNSRITRQIAAYFGDRIPMYVIAEFPRSGGTWLTNMVADYLRCGKGHTSLLPYASRSAIHCHWGYHRRLRRCIYLYRDGRDVMASFYFHRLRLATASDYHYAPSHAERMRKVLGDNFDPEDTATNLPRFLDYEFRHPHSAGRFNWATHVRNWYRPDGRDGILYLSYEELLRAPAEALTRCIRHVAPTLDPDQRLIQRAVDHFSMQSVTGRDPGEEDRTSFVRKGIQGDWVNHYNRAAAEIFNTHAGEELIALGYEKDPAWVDQTPQ